MPRRTALPRRHTSQHSRFAILPPCGEGFRFSAMSLRFLASVLGRRAAGALRRRAAQTVTPPGPPPARPSSRCSRRTTCRACAAASGVRDLDFLFEALKAAPDADTAKQVEDRIWALWVASGSDTANLLMSRVKTATDAKDLDLAHQASRLAGRDQAGLRRGLEPARHDLLHEEGLRPLDGRTSARCWRASRATSARSPGSA